MNKGKAMAHKSCKENDNLPTPFSATIQILEKFGIENIKGRILEPCAGKHFAVARILRHYFNKCNVILQEKVIIKNPIYDYEIKNFIEVDDKYNSIKKIEWIFTNPPFSLWDEFIKRSRLIALTGFILIGKLEFLTGINRYENNIYYPGTYNLKTVYNFTRQCDWRVPLRSDGTYPAGMSHYAAYYFKNGYCGKAEIDFIDNNPFIKK